MKKKLKYFYSKVTDRVFIANTATGQVFAEWPTVAKRGRKLTALTVSFLEISDEKPNTSVFRITRNQFRDFKARGERPKFSYINRR